MTSILEINIGHRLGRFDLDISLSIERELVVLFGPSGAGKSLTLRAVAGLLHPERGRIVLNGRVLFDRAAQIDLPSRLRRVGYVPQSYALFPHMTTAQNIAYGLAHLPSQEAAHRVDEMIELVGLRGLEKQRPAQLSGGQQQRVALARALVARPEVLLLDEPLSALDAPTRADLRRNLQSLQKHFQIPMLFVTHDLSEAYFLADRLAVYGAGRILQSGSPGEILVSPSSLQVARTVGAKNILPGRLVDPARVRVVDHDIEIRPATVAVPGQQVFLCVRPERIMLIRPDRGNSAEHENPIEGTIIDETSDGLMATLYFRAARGRLRPDEPYDLQIDLPVYVYERLGLGQERRWTATLKKNSMHLILDNS